MVNAIWDTDENAITFFKSTVNRQVVPTKISLNREIMMNMLKIEWEDIMTLRRRIPKPPNFNKMPASTIDP